MNKALILVIIAEIWMTIGQICFKISADRLNIEGTSLTDWTLQLFRCLWEYPVLMLGAAAMLIGLFFWLAALNSGSLSFIYLLGSIQYIIMLFAAHYFLQEKINAHKLIGTLLISIGIILTAMS